MTESHVLPLDKQITALSEALAHLGRGQDLKELLHIIRNPGWTTPAELAFTHAILDTMNAQVKQLGQLSAALVKAAGKVGVGK